jgi:uroporphyrinogen III methyltransferase/synthase
VSPGRVYLVGAGPGDPGLLTLRGRQCLARADVVVYDHLVAERLLDEAPPSAQRIYVGKQAGRHTLKQDAIHALLVRHASEGRTVVRLKGGDPMVFGRGGEEALALADAGIPFEIVPGVTAGVAAPACAGIPVTHRGLAGAVTFVTGHEADEGEASNVNWNALAASTGTLVFYMGVANLKTICENLTAHGLAANTPAAAIQAGTTPDQRVLVGTVQTLPERAHLAGLAPPAVLVIGEVVLLRERLAWLERRPLFGRRILVTRPREQVALGDSTRRAGDLADRLEALGAAVLLAPAIRIEPPADPAPLRDAVANLQRFDWIVFTSANAVEAVFTALAEAGLDARALAPVRAAVMGSATAERLARFGVRADLVPETFTTAGLLEAMASGAPLRGARILCPRADVAPKDLVEGLSARGAEVTELTAYRTVADNKGVEVAADALARNAVDWITFTSGSTVRHVVAAVGAEAVRRSRARLASIGPSTSRALRQAGLEPHAEAEPHTTDGLAAAIVASEEAEGR